MRQRESGAEVTPAQDVIWPALGCGPSALPVLLRRHRDSGERVYVTGQVLLDPDRTERLRDRPGGAAAVDAALVHVLAHLFGLADVDDGDQLMGPNGGDEVRELRGGDQLGLALLGRGVCAPDL